MSIWVFSVQIFDGPGNRTDDLTVERLLRYLCAKLPYYLLNLNSSYLYCAATSSGPKKMNGLNKKKPFFFLDRVDTKLHDTYVLKIHVVIRLSINVTGYDESGKSGEGRTGASFTTGRTRFPDEVLTSAERATASLPKLSLTTRARG